MQNARSEQRKNTTSSSRVSAIVLHALGYIFLALALLGIPLPLLPTTPFALLSIACFAKTSPQLKTRIEQSRWLGAGISNWKQHKAVSLRARLAATGLISVSLCLMGISNAPSGAKWIAASFLLFPILFIWTRPLPPKAVDALPKRVVS